VASAGLKGIGTSDLLPDGERILTHSCDIFPKFVGKVSDLCGGLEMVPHVSHPKGKIAIHLSLYIKIVQPTAGSVE